MSIQLLYLGTDNQGLDWTEYKEETIRVIFRTTYYTTVIKLIKNSKRNNGMFSKTMDLFENMSQLNGKAIKVILITNDRLLEHLITKRNYQRVEGESDSVIKYF